MSTLRKGVIIVGGLIAGYLILTNYTGFKTDVRASGKAGSNFAKTLQGR